MFDFQIILSYSKFARLVLWIVAVMHNEWKDLWNANGINYYVLIFLYINSCKALDVVFSTTKYLFLWASPSPTFQNSDLFVVKKSRLVWLF